jgi:DNA-directed RNA polymerase specialized sigma24 family protein
MSAYADFPHESTAAVLRRLAAGDASALAEMCRRYSGALSLMARRMLRRHEDLASSYDPDDALQSAKCSMLEQLLHGKIRRIDDPQGFLLAFRRVLAKRIKARAEMAHAQKRGGPGTSRRREHTRDQLDPGSAPIPSPIVIHITDDFDLFQSPLPPGDVQVVANDTLVALLAALDTEAQSIVSMRLEGSAVSAIAYCLSVSERSVRRKLRKIRRICRKLISADRPAAGKF